MIVWFRFASEGREGRERLGFGGRAAEREGKGRDGRGRDGKGRRGRRGVGKVEWMGGLVLFLGG